MNERLKEFMQAEELTSVKFAEIMGVQPSSISHLLSGRNYPNYDFLSKILLRFPRLNPDWIINGKGSIYRSEQHVEKSMEAVEDFDITNVNSPEGDTKAPAVTNVIPSISGATPDIFSNFKEDDISVGTSDIPSNKDIANDDTEGDSLITNVNKKLVEPVSKAPDLTHEVDKSICAFSAPGADRIVMFFADGTFKEYLKR